MKNKKNKKVDLSRRSILFFQFGLILALFLAWQLIEWKVEAAVPQELDRLSMDAFQDETVPITEFKEPSPPKVPVEIVEPPKVIDDDDEVEESIIAPTEDLGEADLKVEDIKVEEPDEEIDDYSIMSVEQVPVFPGCENLKSNDARRQCMGEKINEIVNRTFDVSLANELGLSGINRIYVSFKIEPDGTVTVIGARGPHPKLEEEAIRIAKTLPEMQPGKQGGKPVGVIYSLPIVFRVQD